MQEIYNFATWANTWLYSVQGTVKDNTYAISYENSVRNHLIPYFTDIPLCQIKQMDIQVFINKQALMYSLDTIKKDKHCLKLIFESACDNGYCSSNPVKNIRNPEALMYQEKQVYTQDQVDMIMEYAKRHRFGTEILVLLDTGIRRGELLGVRWEDIDFVNKVLHIRRAVADVRDATSKKMHVVVGMPKNKYSVRDIPLSTGLCNVLSDLTKTVIIGRNIHKKRDGYIVNTEYVFHSSKGTVQSPRTWSRRHYTIFMEDMRHFYQKQKIDIPFYNPHQMRHTRASLWVNSGKSLYAIAKALGHSDLEMLRQRYAHSNVEELRKLLAVV